MSRIKVISISLNFLKKADVKFFRKLVAVDEQKKKQYKSENKYLYHIILLH